MQKREPRHGSKAKFYYSASHFCADVIIQGREVCCQVCCRFESRWATVTIREDTPAVMLKGMGGSTVGVWCAHGEGKATFPDAAVREDVDAKGLAPIRFSNYASLHCYHYIAHFEHG